MLFSGAAKVLFRCLYPERRIQHRFRRQRAISAHFEGCIARHLLRAQFRGMKMSKIKTLAVAGATALALVVSAPEPAEAGDAGKIIAGLAIGAIAAGIISHHANANTYYPPAYYAQPYPYYPSYGQYYYSAPPTVYFHYEDHHRGKKHWGGNRHASHWNGHKGGYGGYKNW